MNLLTAAIRMTSVIAVHTPRLMPALFRSATKDRKISSFALGNANRTRSNIEITPLQ